MVEEDIVCVGKKYFFTDYKNTMVDIYVSLYRDSITSEDFCIRRDGKKGELVLEVIGIFHKRGDETS